MTAEYVQFQILETFQWFALSKLNQAIAQMG